MNEARLEAARALLHKADNDLKTAWIGLEHDAPLDTVCFHVQQAAEKLLKTALVCIVGYTVYAVVVRYDASVVPELEEAQNALQTVEELRSDVTTLLDSRVWES